MNQQVFKGYADLLRDWIVFSQKHLYRCPENKNLIVYGAGEHGHWGVHTQQKAFSGFAIAATLPEIDFSGTPITKEEVLEEALGMLRYTLRTHKSGDSICTDGQQWGYNWIYALGIERMYHAIEALDAYLTEDDRTLIRTVLIAESEFILNEYTVRAGLVEHNMPESNLWNGAILYRTAHLYPELPNAERYKEKARIFFANGMSIESDEFSDDVVSGVRIRDVFVGANMFNSRACNHHRYMNVGYMNICLSNIAMLHFFFKGQNVPCEDIVYRHLPEMWEFVRTMTFPDGRLLRIGGDSRIRYSYCQDYALPAWCLAEDYLNKDCSNLFEGWLEILRTETAANGDGSFLSNRCGGFECRTPVYYTRLESDRANVISMILYWYSRFNVRGEKESKLLTSWTDEYHGAGFSSSGNRYASFVWRSAERPQALLVPKDDSSLAEWRYNLGAPVLGVGRRPVQRLGDYAVRAFEGGFLTVGNCLAETEDFIAEGQEAESLANRQIAFAALPDEKTVLVIQYAKTTNRVFLREYAGTFWSIPNDIFNKRQRYLSYETGEGYYTGGDYARRFEMIPIGHYVTVDHKIGLASKDPLTLVRRGERQVNVRKKEITSLYCEEICSPFSMEPRWYDRGAEIIDTAFAMALGNESDTKQLSQELFYPTIDGFKAVGVKRADNDSFLLIANFGDRDAVFSSNAIGKKTVTDVATGEARDTFTVKAGDAILFRF